MTEHHVLRAAPPIPFDEVFAFTGELVEWHPLDGGHIHETLIVECDRRYLVQRLNRSVFPNPDLLLANCERVTGHLISAGWPGPRLVPTRSAGHWHDDGVGGAWRAFEFLEGTRNSEVVSGPREAFQAARIFGRFLRALDDLPPPALAEPIPRFHDLAARADALSDAVDQDTHGRSHAAAAELDQARRLVDRVLHPLSDVLLGLPAHTVHNDAKIANVLFALETTDAVAVIDFDTVMPGNVLHDVGELVRTAATSRPESADPGALRIDPTLLDAVATGYLAGVDGLLENEEIGALAWAGPWMTVENGVRFVTDHLQGDRYFRIGWRGQNLARARMQFELATQLLDNLGQVRDIFTRAANP
jgi:hypothetical protein